MARVAAEEGGAWIVDGVVVGDHEAEADAGEGEGSRRRARLVLEGVGGGRRARASPYIGSWARAEGAQKRLQSVYQFLFPQFLCLFLVSSCGFYPTALRAPVCRRRLDSVSRRAMTRAPSQ
jgi:hypothetical protein